MRYKLITLIAVFLMGLLLIPQLSEAAKAVVPYPPGYHQGGHSGGGHYGGGHYGHGGYYGHGYYGHGYYGHGYYGWPYWGWGGYYPYFGLGFSYGYPGFYGYPSYGYAYPAYGYGYPYGSVRAEVKPQTAQIFVDGGFVGKADDYDGWWQRLDLEAGPHRLVFRAPGFQPYVVDVRVVPGQDIHLKYEMVAGNDSISEQEMMLPRSEYQRQYNRRYDNRYQPYDQRDEQYRRRPPENMQPPPDADNDDSYYGDDQNQNSDRRPLILHVEPPDATVYVDGNYYGTANDNGRGEIQVLLLPGNHRVEVVRPGFESFSQNITVSNDQDNHVNVILRKK